MRSIWDAGAVWWDKEAGEDGLYHQQADIDPVIWKELGNVKSKRVIEIGCGNGYFARKLANRGAKVTAVDLSQKLLKFAQDREKQKPLGIIYLYRDATKLSGVRSSTFDIAVADMSLMDIQHADRAIREVSRVLKSNGIFVFSIVHPSFGFEGAWQKVFGRKYFGRFVWRYKKLFTEEVSWHDNPQFKSVHYNRPIEWYINNLIWSGFNIKFLYEITTKKPILKVSKTYLNAARRPSKYTTLAEKKEKLRIRAEIPYFLVMKVQKIK